MSGKENNIPNNGRASFEALAPKRVITSRDQAGNVVSPKRSLPNLDAIQTRTGQSISGEDLLKNSLKRKLFEQLRNFNDNLSISKTLLRSEHLLFTDLMAFFSTNTRSDHRVLFELLFDIQINEYLFIEPYNDFEASVEAAIYLWDAYFGGAALSHNRINQISNNRFGSIINRVTLSGDRLDRAEEATMEDLSSFSSAITELSDQLIEYLAGESEALLEDDGYILKSFLQR